MKLSGMTDGTTVIASIAAHDYVSFKGVDINIIHDGGQPGTNQYAGYNRCFGDPIYFEVPQTFGELYTDYQCFYKNRKYGIWKIEDVKILKVDEFPIIESFDYLVEQSVWGTRGKNGDDPLKYVHLKDCETNHLTAILNTQKLDTKMIKIITHILNEREN